MAACESLQRIFQKPLPENPTLLESLSSWKQIISMKPIEDSSFTEIFGELHFKENRPESSSSSSSSSSSHLPTSSLSSSLSPSSFSIDLNTQSGVEKLNKDEHHSDSINGRNNKSSTASYFPGTHKYNHSDSFSSMNSESLSLCTEGLGFESSDDLEDLKNWQHHEERTSFTKQTVSENLCSEYKRSRTSGGAFPPPISSIGRSGKPWISFKSYRHDGRFILKEIKIQTQDFLHASREDGRLKLQFIQSDDKIIEEDEEEEEEEVVEGVEEEEEKEENNGEKECQVQFSNNEAGSFKC